MDMCASKCWGFRSRFAVLFAAGVRWFLNDRDAFAYHRADSAGIVLVCRHTSNHNRSCSFCKPLCCLMAIRPQWGNFVGHHQFRADLERVSASALRRDI